MNVCIVHDGRTTPRRQTWRLLSSYILLYSAEDAALKILLGLCLKTTFHRKHQMLMQFGSDCFRIQRNVGNINILTICMCLYIHTVNCYNDIFIINPEERFHLYYIHSDVCSDVCSDVSAETSCFGLHAVNLLDYIGHLTVTIYML